MGNNLRQDVILFLLMKLFKMLYWEMSAFGFPDFSVTGENLNEQIFAYLVDDNCSSVQGCTDSFSIIQL